MENIPDSKPPFKKQGSRPRLSIQMDIAKLRQTFKGTQKCIKKKMQRTLEDTKQISFSTSSLRLKSSEQDPNARRDSGSSLVGQNQVTMNELKKSVGSNLFLYFTAL